MGAAVNSVLKTEVTEPNNITTMSDFEVAEALKKSKLRSIIKFETHELVEHSKNMANNNKEIKSSNKLEKEIEEASKNSLLTREETLEYISKAQHGDSEAVSILVESNMKFIRLICRKIYSKYTNSTNFDFDDLVQQGCIGLISAITKFDESFNTSFLTYAYHYINKEVTHFAYNNKYKSFNVPVYKICELNKQKMFSEVFYLQSGRYPTETEISDATSIDIDSVNTNQDLMSRLQNQRSLDTELDANSEEETYTLGDYVASDSNTEDEAIETPVCSVIDSLVNSMSINCKNDSAKSRLKLIVKLRYGCYSLEEIINNLSKVTKTYSNEPLYTNRGQLLINLRLGINGENVGYDRLYEKVTQAINCYGDTEYESIEDFLESLETTNGSLRIIKCPSLIQFIMKEVTVEGQPMFLSKAELLNRLTCFDFGNECWKQKEICSMLKVSRERVRSLEDKFIKFCREGHNRKLITNQLGRL